MSYRCSNGDGDPTGGFTTGAKKFSNHVHQGKFLLGPGPEFHPYPTTVMCLLFLHGIRFLEFVPGGDVTTVVLDPMVTEGNVRVDGNRVRKNSSGDLWIISTSSSRLPSWSWLPDSSRLQLTEERRGITADRALSTVSGPD
jgi:hypothetical protein